MDPLDPDKDSPLKGKILLQMFENIISIGDDIRVNGTSDLKNKTHDQKLTYIPDLSSMSLISGTLLGGPVGALASIYQI